MLEINEVQYFGVQLNQILRNVAMLFKRIIPSDLLRITLSCNGFGSIYKHIVYSTATNHLTIAKLF